MIEILQDFEHASERLSPLILIAPGILGVAIGLFIWLGGFGLRKQLLLAAGGIVGAVLGYFVIGPQTVSVAGLACAGAFLAIVFERFFIGALSAVLAVVVTFAVLARPYIGDVGPIPKHAQAEALNSAQSATLVESYAVQLAESTKQTCSQMPNYNWAMLVAAAVAGMIGGYAFRRTASAVSCATLGAMLIFAGAILLLLNKGGNPITSIFNSSPVYAIVLGAMAALGTVEQLILYRPRKQKSRKTGKSDRTDGESQSAGQTWRTS